MYLFHKTHLLVMAVSAVLFLVALVLGFNYAGLGILFGLFLPFIGVLDGKPVKPSIDKGGLIGLLGLAVYLYACYVAWQHGMTLAQLAESNLPKNLRRLPGYGTTLITAGAVVVALGLARKRDDR